MDRTGIEAVIRTALRQRGSNPYRAAVAAGLPDDAIRHVLAGHDPKASRLSEICDALGLEFYVGPKRAAEDLDEQRLRLALEAAEEGLAEAGRTMDSGQKARLVAAIYDLVGEDLDTETGARVIQLVRAIG